MNIAFRVDSSENIGSGHYSRCVALADYFLSQKNNLIFLSRLILKTNQKDLFKRNIVFYKLKDKEKKIRKSKLKHSKWLSVSQQKDANETLRRLSKYKIDYLFVDHYALDYNWEKIIQNQIKNIIVIDDLADRKHFCKILIDQNFYLNMKTRYNSLVSKNTKLLIGPKYCLLKKNILRYKVKNIFKKELSSILIIFSGTDKYNFTNKTINVLTKFDLSKIKINIIITNNNIYQKVITKNCIKNNFSLYIQPDNIGKIIKNSDFAITPGGVITWEKLYFRLPSIVVATSYNQEKAMKDLSKTDSIIYLGRLLKSYENKLFHELSKILKNKLLFLKTKKNISITIDGNGAKRIYNYLTTKIKR